MSPPPSSSARRPSSPIWPGSTASSASTHVPNSEGTWAILISNRSGIAHAVVGERDLLAEFHHLELVDADVVEGLRFNAEVGPLRRAVAIVGEGQRDLTAIGQQHAVRLQRLEDHLLGIGVAGLVEV